MDAQSPSGTSTASATPAQEPDFVVRARFQTELNRMFRKMKHFFMQECNSALEFGIATHLTFKVLHKIIEQNRFGIASDLHRQIRDVTLLRASAGDTQDSDGMNEDVSSQDGTIQDVNVTRPYRPGVEEEAFAEAFSQLLNVDD